MLVPMKASPHRTAHAYVREALRSAILHGEMKGGARLVQADIAKQLGVSTTPVREALRDLAAEGLIRLDAHRGGIVHELTLEEIEDIQYLIALLEPEAMAAAARVATEDDLLRPMEILKELEEESDPQRWAGLNRQFHASLAAIQPSTRLQNILTSLRDSAAPYIALALEDHGLTHFERANQHHRAIAEALAAQDVDLAAHLAREHTRLTVRAIQGSGPFDGEAIPPLDHRIGAEAN